MTITAVDLIGQRTNYVAKSLITTASWHRDWDSSVPGLYIVNVDSTHVMAALGKVSASDVRGGATCRLAIFPARKLLTERNARSAAYDAALTVRRSA